VQGNELARKIENIETGTKEIVLKTNELIQELSSKIDQLKKDQKGNSRVLGLIKSLKRSWNPPGHYPGKYEAFCCFINDSVTNFDPKNPLSPRQYVFMKQLMEIGKKETLEIGLKNVKVVEDDSGLWKTDCPNCKNRSIIVYRYAQEFDSAEGDVWSRSWFSLCLDCCSISLLVTKNEYT